jgi:aminoglycoside phosphotransferase (APT) family kinase protein
MRQAGQQGVDVPEVLWVGHVDGRAAMVQRFVTGANAGNVPRIRQWRVLGELARRIAAVPLPADAPAALFSRFGPDPPAAWVAHVDYNLSELAAGDPLVDLGVYTGAAERAALRELVAQARNMPLDFGLVHGDLSPRNLRVDLGHDPVLIDWGSASAGPVPFTDLLHLLRARPWMGEPDDAALEAFAQGWGQALDFRTMALFELVSALDLVRWAIERAPGRLDEQVLEARNTVRCLLHTQRAMT